MNEFDQGFLWPAAPLVLVLDRNGKILVWNRTCSLVTGYRLEDVQGLNAFELLAADSVRDKQAFEQVKIGQIPPETEGYLVDKSGKKKWLAWSADVARTPEGELKFVVLTGIDRSRAKRAEEETRVSEAKYAGIVSIASDAIISTDEEQKVVIYNEGAQNTFGWAPKEILGKPLDILIPSRFRKVHQHHIERFGHESVKARTMGERRPAIFGLRKNGEEFPAAAAISKLEIDGRRLFTVVLRDISAQRRVEKEQNFLAEIGAVLASTLEFEETLVKVADLSVRSLCDCCIIYLVAPNGSSLNRWKILLRDPKKSELGKALENITLDPKAHHMDRSVWETGHARLVANVTDSHLQSLAQSDQHLALLRKLAPVSYISLPLRARSRELGIIALISTDPRHHYDAQDVRLGEELAFRSALAIENARLYQVAKKAILVRDDVLSIVAHDLRNPLSAAQIAANALLRRQPRGDSPQPARKMLEVVDRSLQRANRLIQDLLEVSRIEAGRLSLNKTQVLCRELLVEVSETFSPLASEALIDLQTQIPKDPAACVFGDRERIFQVFSNLVDNAIKFTPSGGRVRLGAENRNGEVCFWISDTGPGISSDNMAALFDRFWQADSKDRRGIGFGLSIAKGIVEAHGGEIWAESAVGKGTTFYFTLPERSPAQQEPVGSHPVP